MDKTWAPLVPTARGGSTPTSTSSIPASQSQSQHNRSSLLDTSSLSNTRYPSLPPALRPTSLLPSSLSSPSTSTSTSTSGGPAAGGAAAAAAASTANDASLDPFAINNLPSTVIQRILAHVPVADLPNCALAARPLARFVADDRLWARKLVALQFRQIPGIPITYNPDLSTVQKDSHHAPHRKSTGDARTRSSLALHQSQAETNALSASHGAGANNDEDDDFGDFETGADQDDGFGSFVSSSAADAARSGQNFSSAPVFSYRQESRLPVPSSDANSAYQTFKRIALALKPFLQSLLFETSPTSSLVFTDPRISSLTAQATVVCVLARFVGPNVLGSFSRPDDQHGDRRSKEVGEGFGFSDDATGLHGQDDHDDQQAYRLRMSIRQAADYLEGVLLSAFEGADARRSDAVKAGSRGMDVDKAIERAESDMKDHATLIWHLSQATSDTSSLSVLHPPFARLSLSSSHAGLTASDSRPSGTSPTQQVQDEDYLALLDHPGSAAAQSFLEKRDLLFRRSPAHNPSANFVTLPSASGSAKPAMSTLDFTAMDAFVAEVVAGLEADGGLIARVFPAEQLVLLSFATRLANEVLGEYINAVLQRARSVDVHLYLQSCAATFAQSLKLADALAAIQPRSPYVTKPRCDAIVRAMWEPHLGEYLQEERDWVRTQMVAVCRDSNHTEGAGLADLGAASSASSVAQIQTSFIASNNPAQVKRNVLSGFKNVLLMPVTVVPRAAGVVGGAVIRTAGTGLSQLNPLKWQASSSANTTANSGSNSPAPSVSRATSGVFQSQQAQTELAANNGYVDFSKEVLGGPDGHADDTDDDDDDGGGAAGLGAGQNRGTNGRTGEDVDFGGFGGGGAGSSEWDDGFGDGADPWAVGPGANKDDAGEPSLDSRPVSTTNSNTHTNTTAASSASFSSSTAPRGSRMHSRTASSATVTGTTASTATGTGVGSVGADTAAVKAGADRFSRLQLLLSLDTALSLIQVHRESLKRIETFLVYRVGGNATRVQEELEEVCVAFFQVLTDSHLTPGFQAATSAISSWNPLDDGASDSAPTASVGTESRATVEKEVEVEEGGGGGGEVLPLVQFFELTHIADTMQQLCSVYFTQSLAKLIDAEDFLNPVVRHKKAFESSLDECVAGGLSVSVDLLMNRAEWVLFSARTKEDYLVVGGACDFSTPTKGVARLIALLRSHCKMLVGATDREILDLFHQEISQRLFTIVTKHIKSSVVSTGAAFQLIADLNEITSFVNSLRLKLPIIYDSFNSLKTVANFYIVSPNDLVALLKSHTASTAKTDNFVFGQEELYEFLKSRADFKQIEKQVDHEIFGFKLSEDCIIS
ncbi:hypothetical protein BCV70DRAFT_199540 [Testicularia cyperi]|uniref:F-box domain-containing protein n=1 Tax=Testicularia cyperi TaxID=1882483 RepID=A0A317XTF7_9BASI|nr:hypothetical protein BCV70DRAFT_199540 [Testicularia cyperi]